jgi:hypothetical protein
MATKFFWLPRKKMRHIFWKALDEGFLKTYDTTPLCGNSNFLVVVMLVTKFFLSQQGWVT